MSARRAAPGDERSRARPTPAIEARQSESLPFASGNDMTARPGGSFG
jgi:hypothetical protein